MSGRSFVLDCSVALGAFFEDEQDDYSMAVWRSLESAQALLPALWHLEMGNILSRAVQRGRITREALDDCWVRLAAVDLQTLPAFGDVQHWTQRAVDWGLSTYDACCLDTALAQRIPLASKDHELCDAARRIGVPLYQPSLRESSR